MKKNKSMLKSSEVRKSRCEKSSTPTDGNPKKVRKTQKKIQKAASSRESFQAKLPGIRYCNGQWMKKETIEVLDVRVMKSAPEDMEGIGYERLVLWKMSAGETEELKQQVKQEALHKKRENIMPLVLQMSSDQIETAYEGIIKQWNIPDDVVSDECEGNDNSGDNTSDEENQFEEQLPRSAEAFSLESHVSNEAASLEPANGDNTQIILQSFGETRVAAQIQFRGTDFIAPVLIESSLVAESNTLSDEFSKKCKESNSEVAKSKELVSEPVSDYQLDDCNYHSEGNQSMLCNTAPNSFAANDHGSENFRTTISVAEICIRDSATVAADDTCNTEIPEIHNDLNISPKLIKRKRSTKADYAKKMKFYVDDLPSLVSESLKTQNQDVILTTDHASDKNSAVTPMNTCPNIACPTDPIIQAVAPNKEPGFECTASVEESSTSISINCSSDVTKSRDNKVGTRMKDLSLDNRKSRNKNNEQVNLKPKMRSRNKGHDQVNFKPEVGGQLKPMEAHENVVSFWQPTSVNKSVPDMSNPRLESGKMKNVSEHRNAYGSSPRKERKQRNCALAESRCKDSAKDCDQNLESARKKHLNLALDKKNISGKVTRASSRAMAKSHYQVGEKDLHVSEDVSQQAVLGCKKSVNKCLKKENVSELTAASQIKQKPNTKELLLQDESRVDSDLGQKHADKLSNHILEEDTINTSKRNLKKSVSKCPKNAKVITANHVNVRRVKAVKNNEKKQISNDPKHCQPQVVKNNNRNTKTSQKSSSCGIKVDVSCRNLSKSATMCDKIGTRSRKSKTKDGSQDANLLHSENFTSIGKRKVTKKDRVLRQSEIIESCSNTNFTSTNSNNSCAKTIQSRKNRKLSANDSGPSQTEVIESSSKTENLGMLQNEVTDVNSGHKEDTFTDLSKNRKFSKSSAMLKTISTNSNHKHEKARKGTSNRLRSKSSDEKDKDQDTQSQENFGEKTSLSTQNEFDEKHISLDTEKTELDYTNHASTELEKSLDDKTPCSKTKNDAETDKPEVLTKCSVKLKTGKHDSQKEKNYCNTAVDQIDATILSFNSSPVAETLVVHAADDLLTSRSLNHNNIQHDHVAVSLNICGSDVEEHAKEDPHLTAHEHDKERDEHDKEHDEHDKEHDEHNKEHDGHDKEHAFCEPENSSALPAVARETELNELHCPPQLTTADDSIVDRDEHLLSQSKDDNSEVKCDSCASNDASKNDCLVTRNGNFRLTDYSNGSNNELPDCGPFLPIEVISGINNNGSNKTISPIRSPSPHSSSSPSSKDLQECINGKPLQFKEPVAIPLVVEDPKVRNLLEFMCKAEILRLLGEDRNLSSS